MKKRLSVLSCLLCWAASACTAVDQRITHREVVDSMQRLVGEVVPADFDALPPQPVIGLEEGEEWEIFGQIVDAAQTEEGQTLVLDDRLNRVMMFGPQGQYLDQFGRPGRGPAEFHHPRAIDVGSDGVIRVLDSGNLRVSTLATAGDTLLLVDTQRLPFLAVDFCYMSGTMFFLTARNGVLVEGLDEQGEIVVEFGEPDALDHIPEGALREAARGTLSGGKLACLDALELVVVTGRFTPDVWAFDTHGRAVWHTILQDFKPLSIVTVNDGRATTFQTEDETGTHNRVVGLTTTGDELLVQLATLDWVHRIAGERQIDTRVLSATTGEALGASMALPQLGAPTGSQWVAFLNSPFPRAMVVSTDGVLGAVR